MSEEAGHGDIIAFESTMEDTYTTGLTSGMRIRAAGKAKGNTVTVARPSNGGGGGVPPAQQEPSWVLEPVQIPKIAQATYYTFGSSILLLLKFEDLIPSEVNYVRWGVLGDSFNVYASTAGGTLYMGSEAMALHIVSLPEEWNESSLNELRVLFERTPATLQFYRLHR